MCLRCLISLGWRGSSATAHASLLSRPPTYVSTIADGAAEVKMSIVEINRVHPKLQKLPPSMGIWMDSLRCDPTRMLVLELRCLLGQSHESGGNVWTMLLVGPPCCRLERICERWCLQQCRDDVSGLPSHPQHDDLVCTEHA